MGAYSNLGVFHTAATLITAGGEYSANFIDLAAAVPKIGVGQHAPYLCIRTAVAPTALTDTLSIELRASSGNNGTVLDNSEGDLKTIMMPLADIAGAGAAGVNEVLASDARLATAGAWVFRGQLPYEVDLRYLQLYFNQATHAGNIALDCWLSDGPASDFRGSQVLNSNVGQP